MLGMDQEPPLTDQLEDSDLKLLRQWHNLLKSPASKIQPPVIEELEKNLRAMFNRLDDGRTDSGIKNSIGAAYDYVSAAAWTVNHDPNSRPPSVPENLRKAAQAISFVSEEENVSEEERSS